LLKRILDSPWLYFGLAALLVVFAVVSQFEIHLPSRPEGDADDLATLAERAGPEGDLNLLFILVDTLRADRVSSYGYEKPTTPVMDALASQGIRFQTVIAQSSWTKASVASMMTATYPAKNGVLRWNHVLPEDAFMPAELLQQHGFRTAGIYRNGWVGPKFGFAQGFHNYFIPSPSRGPGKFERHNPSSRPLQGTDEDVTEAAKGFLDNFGHERFFLYLHYMDVHQYAYDEASALFGTDYSGTYDNAIRWLDRNLGALFQHVDDLGLFDKTLAVIVSDHGEGFLEHDLEGHARTVYHEVTYVPWIIVPPFRLAEPVVVEEMVQNVDVWPTILDLMGFENLPDADGVSRVPEILSAARGEPDAHERHAISHLDRHWGKPDGDPSTIVAITRGDLRLIDKRGARFGSERPDDQDEGRAGPFAAEYHPVGEGPTSQLFDISEDPWEQHDIAAQRPEDVARLRAEVDDYLSENQDGFAKPAQIELERMDLESLRALGYVIR
jgi:arylsulfatase A-like enzyme